MKEFDWPHNIRTHGLAVTIAELFGRMDTVEAEQQGDRERSTMIDDFETVEPLMKRMCAALPMRAHVGRDVLQTLRREAPETSFSHQCNVTEVRYAGDEGGILCTLDFDDHASKGVYIVSITHVKFERRNPLFRDIERYKKRRIKRLRRLQGGVV